MDRHDSGIISVDGRHCVRGVRGRTSLLEMGVLGRSEFIQTRILVTQLACGSFPTCCGEGDDDGRLAETETSGSTTSYLHQKHGMPVGAERIWSVW